MNWQKANLDSRLRRFPASSLRLAAKRPLCSVILRRLRSGASKDAEPEIDHPSRLADARDLTDDRAWCNNLLLSLSASRETVGASRSEIGCAVLAPRARSSVQLPGHPDAHLDRSGARLDGNGLRHLHARGVARVARLIGAFLLGDAQDRAKLDTGRLGIDLGVVGDVLERELARLVLAASRALRRRTRWNRSGWRRGPRLCRGSRRAFPYRGA